LDVAVGEAAGAGFDNRLGDAAVVVGAEAGPEVGPGFEEGVGAALEGRVGLPLLFEYWQGPGVLAGDDALLFPVGALDEADAEGGAPRLGQGAELRDGLLRVGEV